MPVQVLVAVPAVVEVAVVNLNAVVDTSISSERLAQVLAPVPEPAATAIIPPPEAMVVEPVVSGSVASISVEPSPPADENAPSDTLYTAILFLVLVGLVAENVTLIVAVVPVGTFK